MKKILIICCMIFLALGISAGTKIKVSLKNVYSYGFVDLEGAKLKAIILEYDQDILASSVHNDTYEIDDYTLMLERKNGFDNTIEVDYDSIKGNEGSLVRAYVNTRPEIIPEGKKIRGVKKGKYVILEVNTAYMLTGQNLVYTTSMMAGVIQKKAIRSVSGNVPASDAEVKNYKSYERQGRGFGGSGRSRVQTVVETDTSKIILPEFAQGSGWTIHPMGKGAFRAHHCYSEYTGKYEDFELPYSIYVPKKEVLEANRGNISLVIHMEHAGGNSIDPYAAITSSRASVKLASQKVQAENPAIIVVPQVEEKRRSTDDYDATSEMNTAAWELIDSLLLHYRGYINEERIYGTGQSMGGMLLLNMAKQRDNFFGGLCLVGAQWSNNYDTPYQHDGAPARTPVNDTISFNGFGLDKVNFQNWYYMVSDDNILVHTCKDDPMATSEWQYLADYYAACGVTIPTIELNPHSDLDGQNAADRQLVNQQNSTGIFWGSFSEGNHMSTWKYGYQLDAPFEWLFRQRRSTAQNRPKLEQLKNPFLGRDDSGKVKEGSGTAGMNSAQFTPHGISKEFPENWKPVIDTLALNHPEYLPSLAIGEQAPDFTAADTLGGSISLSQFRGKYVVLDFWATWCGDCRREIPFLKELYNDVKDKKIGGKGMQWLSLSFDTKREQWISILRKEKFPWPQISTLKSRKEDPTFSNFKLNWIPAFFILDPDGKVVAKAITADGLRAEINKL